MLATLLRELAAARCERVWLVTGHLAEQVEHLAGDGSAFGVEIHERPHQSFLALVGQREMRDPAVLARLLPLHETGQTNSPYVVDTKGVPAPSTETTGPPAFIVTIGALDFTNA